MPETTLRYDGTCVECRAPLPAGARAFYDPHSRRVSCSHHRRQSAPYGRSEISARTFADQVADEHRAAVRRRWGVLAPLAAALGGEDAKVRAARKGAAGEERLGSFLDRVEGRSGGRVAVLHDRRIPGRRENIDHIVVCPTGVWAVDAKAYSGRISTGTLFGSRLRIGRRDGDKLVEQSRRQQRHLAAAFAPLGLPTLPTGGALCFLDADIGWWHNGRRVEGVLVSTPRVLRRELLSDGPLTPDQVAWTRDRLDSWFPRA